MSRQKPIMLENLIPRAVLRTPIGRARRVAPMVPD